MDPAPGVRSRAGAGVAIFLITALLAAIDAGASDPVERAVGKSPHQSYPLPAGHTLLERDASTLTMIMA